jgi:EmrB/QacA subfamily drug resistance transporter
MLLRLTASRATLLAATIASGVTSLPTTALGVALPTIHDDLEASLSQLQWTLTAYSLAYASLLIVAGRLGDIFGHRRFFIGGTIVFGLGAVSAALAPHPIWLIFSLGIIGAGAAAIVPASLSILTNEFEGRSRVRAVAVWGAASGIVSGLGPPLGGILVDKAGWPAIFWATALCAVAILAVAFHRIAESWNRSASRTIDYNGVFCLAGAITMLALGLIEAPTWGWGSIPTLVSFGASAALLGALVFVERRSPNPIIELSILRYRNFVGGVTVKFVVNFALATMLFLLPLYLQEILNYSPLGSGLLLLPLSGTLLVSLPLGGRLMERYGPRVPIVIGLALATVSLVFIADMSIETTYADLWPPMLALGFGIGLVLTPMNLAAVNAVPVEHHGAATGIMTTVIGLGGVVGVALTAAVFRTLEDEKLDHILARTGPRLPNSVERVLEGILVQADDALEELAKYPPHEQRNIVGAVRDGFVYGISNGLSIAVGVAGAGVVLTMLLFRRRSSTPSRRWWRRPDAAPAAPEA